MPLTTIETRKRLTREESRALTRSRLIAVGREHFLRYGLGGAVVEKIAEEAGYSRGALYFNFDTKEELFLAVIEEQETRRSEIFRSILNEKSSSQELLRFSLAGVRLKFSAVIEASGGLTIGDRQRSRYSLMTASPFCLPGNP